MFYYFTQVPIDDTLMFDENQTSNVIIEADNIDLAYDRIFKLRFRNDLRSEYGYRLDNVIEIISTDIFLFCQNIADKVDVCDHPPVILHLEDCPPIPFYKFGSLLGRAGVEGREGNAILSNNQNNV